METITTIINWFAVFYVGIPILSFFIILIYLYQGGSISPESQKRIFEFSKWYIVSVAIVFAAKIIETSFTERETGIKEMQVYDKYVATILEADNIESRWKLAEYFSTVTPTERLRERWVAYKETIKPDYLKFKELDQKEIELLSKDSLTSEQKNTLNIIQKEKATFERRLVDKLTGKWVVVFTADTELEPSKYELNNLIKAGIEDPKIYFRNNSYRTISKTFSSKQDALDYKDLNKNKIRNDAYIVNLDNWCSEVTFNGEFYECN
jgi:hypothetical protein